jgi:hypothetical protein
MATTGTTKAKRPSVDAILDALCQHPGATAAELAEAAGIGRSTASKTLASLEADGQVTSQRAASESGKPAPDRWTLIVDTPASDVDHATPERRPTTAGEPAAQPVSTTTSDAEERGDEPAPPVTTPDPEGDAVTEGALDTLYRLTPNSSRPRLAVYRMAACWAQTLLLDGDLRVAEPKTLRYRLWHVAARVVRHARRLIVRLQRTWPWAATLAAAFTRLRALPLRC